MLAGNFGAQIVSLLFYPILVRIYKPEDFGIFGTFSSFMVIAAIFASGQLQMAFIKCLEDELNKLLWVYRIYALTGAIITTVIVFLINLKLNYFSANLMALFPVCLVGYMLFESNKMLAISRERFKSFSGATGLNRIGSNVFKMLLGTFSPTSIALVLSEIITNFLTGWTLLRKLNIKAMKPESPWIFLGKFRHFPLYATLSNFFQLGLMEFPVILLAAYYGKYEVGLYVLTLRLVLQPLAVIGNSIGSIASKKMVHNHAEKISNIKILIKIYGFYITTGILVFLVIFFIPETWVTAVLGNNWDGIKDVIVPVAILSAAKLSSGLHIYYYIAAEAIKIKSIWKASQLLSVIILITLYNHMPFSHLLWITCSTEAVIDLMFTIYTICFQAKKNIKHTLSINEPV